MFTSDRPNEGLSTLGELTNKEHRTNGALYLKNELFCYQCDTMEDHEKCSNLATGNKSLMLKKCYGDKRLCMVGSIILLHTSLGKSWNKQWIVCYCPGEKLLVYNLDGEHDLSA
jgi:hypothetical protein